MTYKIGEEIRLGKYLNKDIIWKVVDIKGDKAFIVTKECLFNSPYKENPICDETKELYASSYKDSDIRKYLNDEFYHDSFSNEEKKLILKTLVSNGKDSCEEKENDMLCEDTLDYLFLLSYKEYITYFRNDKNDTIVYYWLRTPDYLSMSRALYVYEDKWVHRQGVHREYGIRIACNIKIGE